MTLSTDREGNVVEGFRLKTAVSDALPDRTVWCINVTIPLYLCCAYDGKGPALLGVGNPPFRRVFPLRPLSEREREECRLVGL